MSSEHSDEDGAPLWQADAARPLRDGVAADESFSVTSEGRLLVVVRASLALRALLFGAPAVGAPGEASLAGRLQLAGLSPVEGAHAAHFGLATAAAPLPLTVSAWEYVTWGLGLRGYAARAAKLLAEASLSRWSLAGRAKVRIERLTLVERAALRLAAAGAAEVPGLIVERPYAGLGGEQAAALDERLVAVAEERDVILLVDAVSTTGPYAAWLRRASDVLLFRAGRLQSRRSGLMFWRDARLIEVEVVGSAEVLSVALSERGMAVQRAGSSLLVALGDGHDMQTLLAVAVAEEVAVVRCAPAAGGVSGGIWEGGDFLRNLFGGQVDGSPEGGPTRPGTTHPGGHSSIDV